MVFVYFLMVTVKREELKSLALGSANTVLVIRTYKMICRYLDV